MRELQDRRTIEFALPPHRGSEREKDPMQVTSPELTVDAANLQVIDIGQVRVGPIQVGSLTINNTTAALTGAAAILHNVSVEISIHVALEWHVHVGMPDWIPDINEGDTHDLGSLRFPPLSIGDVTLPALNDINLDIPTITGQNVSAGVDPLTLSLTGVTASDIAAEGVTLPANGFTLSGIGLGTAQVTGVGVPETTVDRARVARLVGDTVQVPAISLNNIDVGAIQIPTVSSTAPLVIPAVLDTRSIGFGDNDDLLSVRVRLTPSATSRVGALDLSHANATAALGQVTVNDVTLPFEVLGLTLSQIGVSNLAIPAINVS